ncbi:MAG: DUF4421 domain-containing protein [Flavobacteriales bacterium]|nr:DUF4421 domain-containing protein [Flavobacteriales bacterium]
MSATFAARSFLPILLLTAMTVCATRATAQKHKEPFDTLYVRDYSHILTGRFYLSTKDNAFALRSRGGRDLVYRPNNQINWGLGASYRALTLNIGIRMPVVNDNDDEFGRTRYLDAQANILTKRTATNLFLQVFRGYHLRGYTNAELRWPELAQRPYRPDVRQFNFGFSSLRITNNDRFSYRASFNQDAWQRKSQGSWLVGGYMTYFGMRADSSIVPTTEQERFTPEVSIRRGDFFDAGPMGGYVYTFVFKEHWFATVSAVGGAGIALQGLYYPLGDLVSEGQRNDAGAGYRFQWRAGAGYNSARHYVGLSFNQERVGYFLQDQQRFTWNVYNLRFNIVRRFNTRVGFMDRGIKWLRKKGPAIIEQALPPELPENGTGE